MNPEWLPGLIAALGVIVNTIWTAVNLQMRNDLARQVADLKVWLEKEYVPERVCHLRMAPIDRRYRGDQRPAVE
jgi:hypothetical protein